MRPKHMMNSCRSFSRQLGCTLCRWLGSAAGRAGVGGQRRDGVSSCAWRSRQQPCTCISLLRRAREPSLAANSSAAPACPAHLGCCASGRSRTQPPAAAPPALPGQGGRRPASSTRAAPAGLAAAAEREGERCGRTVSTPADDGQALQKARADREGSSQQRSSATSAAGLWSMAPAIPGTANYTPGAPSRAPALTSSSNSATGRPR